jgi:hypothetical protein
MANQRFVVAEVSKNWEGNQPVVQGGQLISQSFEQIINHWDKRGYKLHSFSLHRLTTGTNFLNETIIAVFERDTTDA